jgi:hypothetical protein
MSRLRRKRVERSKIANGLTAGRCERTPSHRGIGSPEQALQEIASAAPQLGFFIGNAIVNKWAGDAGERAARWLLGDGTVDAAAANPIDGVLVYIIGTIVRAVVSEEEHKLEAQYEARQLYFG